ncbi:hypothetical protein [Ruegeria pomeroyi]|nr:hypothetical protein [Ruegeria pomeroyi]NVK95540.1 hypothetical protein [Ruegeria pomeroyi]NVK99812.1 hypothetical protein [Ruegeria pomeroyi]HCE70953.1 hypothetical protein [Ruegeria sp.]
MKAYLRAGAVLALTAVVATSPEAQQRPTKPGSDVHNITISCFRGPTSSVIWDRPNAVFVEDLVRMGYTYPEAHAIGERICRDEWGVGQHDYMRSSLLQIVAKTPPSH